MEFPREILDNILSYFHSAYKKPLHYSAIMGQKDFYHLKIVNKKYTHICGTYFIKIFINSRMKHRLKNINTFKNIGVAAPNIFRDYVEIIDDYKFSTPYMPQLGTFTFLKMEYN